MFCDKTKNINSNYIAGGHGTTIAWGEMLAEKGVDGLSELSIASATFRLILGSLLVGQLAIYLIEKYQLRPIASSTKLKDISGQKLGKPIKHKVSIENVVDTIFALAICIFWCNR